MGVCGKLRGEQGRVCMGQSGAGAWWGETSSLRSREQGEEEQGDPPGAIAGAERGEGGGVGAERWRPAPAPS